MRLALVILLISLAASLAMIMGEVTLPHIGEDVRIATQALTKGKLSARFWGLAVALGLVAPIVLAVVALTFISSDAVEFAAAILALAGLWWFEELWVKAGQCVPLS